MDSNSKRSYFQTYKETYSIEFPCIKKSRKGEKYAFCDICSTDFNISHGGRNDIFRHVNGPKHKENVKLGEKNSKLSDFFMPLLLDLLKELFFKFMKPSQVKGKELLDVNFHSSQGHKDFHDLVIGSAASQIISKCSEEEQELFHEAIIKYFVTACEYIAKKFPLKNDVLKHAEVTDLNKIEDSSFMSIRYFVARFPFLLKRKNGEAEVEVMDELEKEFSQLQLEDLSSIASSNKEIDSKWAEVKKLRSADGILKYERIADLIISILLIPHSNAECERIFSLVRKNRTECRTLMSNKTLESLLILKTRNTKVCYDQTFEGHFLQKAKKATAAALNSASTSKDM